MFNPVAPYRYLLPSLYLSVVDIANPDLFACGGRTWISLDIARFYEEHCQPYPAGPHGRLVQKNGNRAPIAGAGGVDSICTGFASPLSQLHHVYAVLFGASAPKFSVMLLTPDTHQAKIHPSIFIKDSHLPLVKCPRIFQAVLKKS